jgi:hypothetical protein
MRPSIRIGNGCGFWGDNQDAPVHLAAHGGLDYLTLEYLAELTMSILAQQKQRDANAGYASDFIGVLERLTPHLHQQPQLRIVTNAGGMNPHACARAARAVLDQAGLHARTVAVVSGDDLLPRLDELLAAGHPLAHQDTGQPLAEVRSRVVSANAYLGAEPIARALAAGADVVITGRVADAALTLGPAVHELGWSWADPKRLGMGLVAGHLIECGAQATGGLWCNWQRCDLAEVGYPIVTIYADGTLELSKPAGSGGAVNLETVREQLLYEVGDPARYLTPDGVVDFTKLHLDQVGSDCVRLTADAGVGLPPPDSYKVSIAYRDGYTATGTLVIAGPGAVAKARACGEIIRRRLQQAGLTLARYHVETLGAGATVPDAVPTDYDPTEVVLRVAVHDPRREAVERFSRELAPLVTSGPPGVTGYTTGRPPVREVFAYWPALIARAAITPTVEIMPSR